MKGPRTVSDTPPHDSLQASPPAGTAIILPLSRPVPQHVTFNRAELNQILNLYGRMVASGEWRDYAMDFMRDTAVFSVFRRTSETPLYKVVKNPALARKQGAYAVISASGQVLKRGHDLARVLAVFDKARLTLV
jgi:Protein of unknown function (DUF2794)